VEPEDLLAGLAIAVGIVGIVVPLLPGSLLVGGAIVAWAAYVGGATAWSLAGAAVAVLLVGAVVKYAVPGRNLRTQGVPGRTLAAGALFGIVGFFVVPVVGLVLGFVLGVYLSEVQRLGSRAAWPATKHALRAVGLALLIEALAAVLAAGLWLTGAALT
jgi:uncharacterized protein YqgC (DUF456 family)